MFSGYWWNWWSLSQPEWRERDYTGRVIIGGSGPWTDLKVGGINGIISFIMSLGWWGRKLVTTKDDSTLTTWQDAVKDVTWALSECVHES
jgi:hypothetical protein